MTDATGTNAARLCVICGHPRRYHDGTALRHPFEDVTEDASSNRVWCPNCRGRGQFGLGGSLSTCGKCGGSGMVYADAIPKSAAKGGVLACPQCPTPGACQRCQYGYDPRADATPNHVLEVGNVIEAIGSLFPSADEPTGPEKAYGDAIQDAIDAVARLSRERAT